ncbi:50S ribosomal protein L15e [Candidatus Bathyarchaeota archaeon]|nr:50S ribosomal protein L15e [Candidatus Bathyarchaeota archaeon]MBS7613281.1 50S ribosomal protein L15e [Candidatus Bathyarchaeota archaeon]MBS7618663.1 50S ribosomal protein L15e [Candidatus Bathyarchaeota archaeon]
MYSALAKAWRKPKETYIVELMRERVISWRRQPTVVRIDKPTKLHTARRLGYKAKPGIVVVRVRVRKGSGEKPRPRSGRRPKAIGVKKIKRDISKQKIAEERVLKKYPNLKLVGSYYVWEDGVYKWYECILCDPQILGEPKTA